MIEIGKEIKGKKNQKWRLNYKVPQWKILKWQVNMKVFLKIGKQPGGNNVKKEVKGPAKVSLWKWEKTKSNVERAHCESGKIDLKQLYDLFL